jgi:hypothetical protein
MHHDVYRQIRTGVAMHNAYVVWMHDRTASNYEEYLELKSLMDLYVPDPNAKF